MARALTQRSALIALLFLAGAAPSMARADAQVSARLGVGGGAAFLHGGGTDGFFALHLVAEASFGPRLADTLRVGPWIELRTNDFRTAEAALGVSVLVPVTAGWPLALTAALGYASRRDGGGAGLDPEGADGALAAARVAFGYRPYNYHSRYAYGLQLFVELRRSVTGPERWEVGGGVEVDLEFLLVIPVLFVATWLGRGDPDEPTE